MPEAGLAHAAEPILVDVTSGREIKGLAAIHTELEKARAALRKAEADNLFDLVAELNGRVAYLEELIFDLNREGR